MTVIKNIPEVSIDKTYITEYGEACVLDVNHDFVMLSYDYAKWFIVSNYRYIESINEIRLYGETHIFKTSNKVKNVIDMSNMWHTLKGE